MTLAVAARLVAKEGQQEQVRDALQRLVVPTMAEEGCILFRPHVDEADPRQFFVYELWVDEAALLAHRETEHYREYALGVIFDAVEYRDRLLLQPLD